MEGYRILDEPMDVQLAHKRAKELQKRIENELGIETDQKLLVQQNLLVMVQ